MNPHRIPISKNQQSAGLAVGLVALFFSGFLPLCWPCYGLGVFVVDDFNSEAQPGKGRQRAAKTRRALASRSLNFFHICKCRLPDISKTQGAQI